MSVKTHDLVDVLRENILSGVWRPADRLPTRDELLMRYPTSRGTLQKAINQLIDEGFIVACGKSGTFVSVKPPHLNTIGLVFPANGTQSPAWDSMWSRVVAQKVFFEARFGRQLRCYYLEQDYQGGTEYRQLMNDAANGRLAGVIFPYTPNPALVAALAGHNLRVTAITGEKSIPGLIPVWLDYAGWFAQCFDFLEEKQRSRIALLSNVQLPLDYLDDFRHEIRRRKMFTDDCFVQGVGFDSFSHLWTVNLVKLMMRGSAAERPDGLIVANENLLEWTMEALHQLKLVPGQALDIAVHANFPSSTNAYGSIERIGFDVRRMIELCLEAISAPEIRAGEYYGRVPAFREKALLN